MTDLDRIQSRRAELRAELDELDIAARVLERLNSGKNGAPATRIVSRPSAGNQPKTIAEFASSILAQAGEAGMHFSEVADAAMSHGYKGRSGSTEKAIRQSFWATMRRDGETFEMLGEGKFRLK